VSARRQAAAAARTRRLRYGAWYVPPEEWSIQQQIRNEAAGAASAGHDSDDDNDEIQRMLKRARARARRGRGPGQAGAQTEPSHGAADTGGDADGDDQLGHMVASLEARIPSLFISKAYKAYLTDNYGGKGRVPAYLENVVVEHTGEHEI
jgi:hypothetical protein